MREIVKTPTAGYHSAVHGPPSENIFCATLGRHAMDLSWTEVQLGAQSFQAGFIGAERRELRLFIPRDEISVIRLSLETPHDHSDIAGVVKLESAGYVLMSVEGIELWGVMSGSFVAGDTAKLTFHRESVIVLDE